MTTAQRSLSPPPRLSPRPRLLVRLGALAALIVPLVVGSTAALGQEEAQGAESVEGQFLQLVEEASQEEQRAVALSKLYGAGRLRLYLPQERVAEALLERAARVEDPLVRFQFLREAEWALRDLGDARHGKDAMAGPLGQQACLRDFTLVGPFANNSMEGFEAVLAPEDGEEGPYPGKMSDVVWRSVDPQHSRMCVFDLDRVVDPSSAAVVYLSTELTSDGARRALLSLGAAGAYRAWLNGRLVAEQREDMGLGLDAELWPVELKKGGNRLLIKLGSTGDGGLELVARLLERKTLEPLTAVKTEAHWRQEAVQAPQVGAPRPLPDPRGVMPQIRAGARGQGAGDDIAWVASLWPTYAPHDASTPWVDVAEQLYTATRGAPLGQAASVASAEEVVARAEEGKGGDGAAVREPVSPRLLALVAQMFEEHWKRLEVLEVAQGLAPQDPWIATQLAAEYARSLSQKKRFARLAILDKVVERHPDFLLAQLDRADWYRSYGFGAAAYDLLEGLVRREPFASAPLFLMRLHSEAEEEGTRARAEGLQQRLGTIARLSSGWDDGRFERLSKANRPAEALALADEMIAWQPWSVGWQLRRLEMLRALGRTEEALAEYDALIASNPGSTFYLERKAELLASLRRHDEAVAVLKEALRQRPQDESLYDKLSFLQPRQDRFHEPWMIEDARALGEGTAAGAFHSDTLVDQTIVQVAPNGLAQSVGQVVERVNTKDGLDAVRRHQVSFTSGDERVDVLRVRVYKPDGTISEDYDTWSSGSARKGSTTYNDTSFVTMQANNVEVGDLVEFRWRTSQVGNRNFRGDYFGDISYLQSSQPIAFARYAVLYPEDWKMHFRAPKLTHERIDDRLPGGKAPLAGFRSTAFVMRDVPEAKTEEGQPGHTEVYDYLLVSNKKTFDEIGAWWWELVKEQLIVNEDIRETVRRLVRGTKTQEEKVRAIYDYVVKNTRYLHVGLGIHGWKPYRTTTCFRNRYGDCKDKASLLKVMLEEAGVPANLVLVRTRKLGKVDGEPASMHIFNHAITYVPGLDLFLDGTAEYNGTRELTPMDQGAQALIVMNGGTTRWVELPVDAPEVNNFEQTIEVDLSGEEPVASGRIVAHGANAVYYRTTLEDPERREEEFGKQLARSFPGAELLEASFSELQDLEKPVEIRFRFKGGELVRTSGARRFVYPAGVPKDMVGAYADQTSRDQDLTIRVPFANETTMRYRLGPGQTFEKPPQDIHLTSPFGELHIDYQQGKDGRLTVATRYDLAVQRVAREEYPAFRRFMSEATTALNHTLAIEGDAASPAK